MKKILGVIRTSTERQETLSQKQEMEQFIVSLGYKVEEIEWIEVAGASARKLNKKYMEMIEGIKTTITNSKINSCALWHLNRLGRVDTVLVEMKNWFISNHIQLYVKNPYIKLLNDDGTVNGGAEIAFGVFATMVKQDTEELFEKFHRGKRRNSEQGRFNGGRECLFGYEVNEGGYVVPNPQEAEVVRRLFQMYGSGDYSIVKLLRECEQLGITIRGRKITHTLIQKMLRNTAYIGYTDSDRLQSHRTYIPIIDDELWNKVKDMRERNTQPRTTKESKHKYLAIKILKCQCCGRNYIADDKTYICYTRKTTRITHEHCNGVCVNTTIMDKSIVWLTKVIYLAQVVSNTKGLIKSSQEQIKALTVKIKATQKGISDLDIKYERLNELYLDMSITKEQYTKRKEKIDSEGDVLRSQMKGYENTISKLRTDISLLSDKEGMLRSVNNRIDVVDNLTKDEIYKIAHDVVKCAIAYKGEVNGIEDCTILKLTSYVGKDYLFAYKPHRKTTWRYDDEFKKGWIEDDLEI